MKKSFFLLMVMIMFLFLGTSCTTSHFGVPDRASGVPTAFDQTETAIAQAEQSSGAKYCPNKIARAKELAKKAAETYWACRTDEAMDLLAEARKLAKEAEGCRTSSPPPKPAPAPKVIDKMTLCFTDKPWRSFAASVFWPVWACCARCGDAILPK